MVIRFVLPQSKELGEGPAESPGMDPSLVPAEERKKREPADTLISDFWPPKP